MSASRSGVRRIPWDAVPFQDREWRGSRGRFVLSFVTELPFEIPVGRITGWALTLDEPHETPRVTHDEVLISLSPSSHPQRLPQHLSAVPDWTAVVANFNRFAKAVPCTFSELCLEPGPDWRPEGEILTRCFDQGLSALNRFLIEYAIATMDPSVRDVSKEDLPAIALVTFKDLEARYYSHTYLRLHYLDGIEKRALTEDECEVIEERLRRDDDALLRTYHQQRVRADRLPDQGDYAGTVLATAIAIESLVSWALVRHSSERDSTITQPVSRLMRRGIVRVVTEQLSWLDGDWSVDGQDSPTGTWKIRVADLRNKIVHEGSRPDYRQAVDAMEAGKSFSDTLFGRLRATGRALWTDEARAPSNSVVRGRYQWDQQRPD